MGDFDNREREEVFSKKVRAGKRTYFFDVKATRSNDYYVTITESKKRLEDGVFIKHKIFLYKEDFENREREEVFSKKVRAGKRTYFFDVKATRSNDYYVTITESKKRLEDGVFIKHKIFLYKEDFEKFAEGLKDTIEYIKANQEVVEKRYEYSEAPEVAKTADEDFSFEI